MQALSVGVLAQSAQDSVGDERSTAIVYTVVVVLVVIGIALIGVAVWLWSATRPDRELLAPLELMGDTSWRRQDPQGRRRALDDVRPDGAVPLVPSVSEPRVDEEFDEVPPVADFDDLTEPVEDPLVIDIRDKDDDVWDHDARQEADDGDDGAVARDVTPAEQSDPDDEIDWEASAADVLDKVETAAAPVGERDDTAARIVRPTPDGYGHA